MRFLLGLLVGTGLVLLAGALYQAVAAAVDRRRFPPPGKRQAGTLGDRPLVVLTAGKLEVPQRFGVTASDVEAMRQVWHKTQLEPAQLSTRTK